MSPVGHRRAEAVRLHEVSKAYGRVLAVDGVSFDVQFGECVALVGPNGAGKTTTLRILARLLPSFEGVAEIDGVGLPGAGGAVGALIEQPAFYPYLSTRENLVYYARVAGRDVAAVAEVIDRVGLAKYSLRRAGTLSHGNRQRLGLAIALLADSNVLLLDEPLTGLDPPAQVAVRRLLLEMKADGKAILLSSHNLPEVEAVADELVFIRDGRVVDRGPVAQFTSPAALEIHVGDPEAAAAQLVASGYEVLASGDGRVVLAAGTDLSAVLEDLSAVLIFPNQVVSRRGSIEDSYLGLLGAEDE